MVDKRGADERHQQQTTRTRSRDREIRRISREQRAQQSAVRIAQPQQRSQHSLRTASEASPSSEDDNVSWQSILQEIKDSLTGIAAKQSTYDETRTDINLMRAEHHDIKASCAQTTTDIQLLNKNFQDTIQAMRVPTSDASVVAGLHLRFDCLNDNLSALRSETTDQCTAANLAMGESFSENHNQLNLQDQTLESLLKGNIDLAEDCRKLHSEFREAGTALSVTTVKGLEMMTKFSQAQYRRFDTLNEAIEGTAKGIENLSATVTALNHDVDTIAKDMDDYFSDLDLTLDRRIGKDGAHATQTRALNRIISDVETMRDTMPSLVTTTIQDALAQAMNQFLEQARDIDATLHPRRPHLNVNTACGGNGGDDDDDDDADEVGSADDYHAPDYHPHLQNENPFDLRPGDTWTPDRLHNWVCQATDRVAATQATSSSQSNRPPSTAKTPRTRYWRRGAGGEGGGGRGRGHSQRHTTPSSRRRSNQGDTNSHQPQQSRRTHGSNDPSNDSRHHSQYQPDHMRSVRSTESFRATMSPIAQQIHLDHGMIRRKRQIIRSSLRPMNRYTVCATCRPPFMLKRMHPKSTGCSYLPKDRILEAMTSLARHFPVRQIATIQISIMSSISC